MSSEVAQGLQDLSFPALFAPAGLIHCPASLPPHRDPIVISLNEADIDEEDSDEFGKPLALSQVQPDLNAAHVPLPLSFSTCDGVFLASSTVALILRC